MERCKTCKHWTPYATKYLTGSANADERAGGYCESGKIVEDQWTGHAADMLIYPYREDGDFWTGPEFGCVHHTPEE